MRGLTDAAPPPGSRDGRPVRAHAHVAGQPTGRRRRAASASPCCSTPSATPGPTRRRRGRVLLAGRAVDGDAARRRARAGRGADGQLRSVPGGFPGGAPCCPWPARGWRGTTALRRRATGPSGRRPTPPAWDTRRFEHRFAASAGDDDVRRLGVRRRPPRLARPRRRRASRSRRRPPAPAEATAVAIPVPLTYPGMPAHRYWEIEDGRVDFGAIQAGSTDIVRMLLTDFALVYGEDWFLVPIERAGRLGRADHVDGGSRHVRRSSAPSPRRSARSRRRRSTGSGRCTARPPPRAPALGLDVLFVPPSLADDARAGRRSRRWPSSATRWPTWCGPSNARCRAPLGTPIDRYRTSQPASAVHGAGRRDAARRRRGGLPVGHAGAGQLVPVPGPADAGRRRHHPRAIGRAATRRGPSPASRASSRTRRSRRGGLVVQRAWQFARWTGGQPVLWFGRRVTSGRGEGSSGLRWDATEPRPGSA